MREWSVRVSRVVERERECCEREFTERERETNVPERVGSREWKRERGVL